MALASLLGQRLNHHQSQSLVMTPQLRQAIQLLQFSNIEASNFVEEELLSNPLLERESEARDTAEIDQPQQTLVPDEPDLCASSGILPEAGETTLDLDVSNVYDFGTNADGYSRGSTADETGEDWDAIAALVAQPVSLREHINQQVRLSFSAQKDQMIASAMILALDPSGRLGTTPSAIADAFGVDYAYIEEIRALMMRFEPVGLFATSLEECLAVQLLEKNRLDPAMQALLDNLPLLAKRDFKTLQVLCGVDAEDLMDMVAEIKRLDPKPGTSYQSTPLQPLIPDVLMRSVPKQKDVNSDWLLELNPETMPRLLIRHGFHAQLLASTGKDTRSFLSEQMQRASWLVKALEARAQTILKVSAEIVRRQEDFFKHGISHLKPLTLRDIAIEVGLHESTVSRVTSNKSIATPRGIFEIKFFFSTALVGESGQAHSAEAVRHRVNQLISAENPKHILSDDAIVILLQKEGIDIARRTVAKYRDALRIPGSAQRRRNKNTA